MARMLLLRSAGIGDVAMLVHAVRALRACYPQLEIVIATKPRMPQLFEGIEGLEFILIKDFRGLLREIRSANIDCCADLRNELRGKLVRLALWFRGIPTASYRQNYAERRPLLKKKKIVWLRNNVLRFCDVFARLGYPVPTPPVVHIPRPMPSVFGPKEGTWVGFAPFAASELKMYPEPLRTELVKALAARYSRVFLFSGGGQEAEYCQKMAEQYPSVTSVFKKVSMGEEVALMSHLDLMITMDSSAMHMASLAGVPLVAIWGATHPAIGYSAWGADPEKNYIQSGRACRPCSVYGEGKCPYKDLPCMRDISVEDILAKAGQLLSEASAQ